MWLAFLLALTPPPSAAPSPFIVPPCVSDADVDAHIDPRLPPWVRIEIRAVMLAVPPCSRGGSVGATDSHDRFITNSYDDYVESTREWVGHWVRVDVHNWRSPGGFLVEMPFLQTPSWIIGKWKCASEGDPAMLLQLRSDATGTERDLTTRSGVNEQGKFVTFPAPWVPIELYSYEPDPAPTIYAGMRNSGAAYAVTRTATGMKLRNWGFFRYGDGWLAMPSQTEFQCTRSVQS